MKNTNKAQTSANNVCVLYSSSTGNTRKLCVAIADALGVQAVCIDERGVDIDKEKLYFVGFWIDKGQICQGALDWLWGHCGLDVVLCFTAGIEREHEYAKQLKDSLAAKISARHNVRGVYMCQGRISDELIANYHRLAALYPNDERYAISDERKRRWEQSKSHPSAWDLADAQKYAKLIFTSFLKEKS